MKVVDPLVFAAHGYEALADEMARAAGAERGALVVRHFPDGEVYHRVDSELVRRHVVLVGGTVDDATTLELYDLACGMVAAGAETLTLVLPYFAYSTMERAVHKGEVVKAKTRARLYSAIPYAPGGNRVILLDLHAEGVTYYFEGLVRPVHASAQTLVAQVARELVGHGDFVLGCTDAGRAKWVESLAHRLGVGAAFVYKRRLDGHRTEITGVSAHVEGRDVVVYDDMIRTGGSLIHAARAYRDAGARRLWAIATHGVLPADAVEQLSTCQLFERVVTTNSHPRALAAAGGLLEVVSVAPLLMAKVLE